MTNTGGSATPAGWYTDPGGSGQLRWWDGAAWSAHLAPRPAPTPAPGPTPTVQQPAAYQPVVLTAENRPYVPFQGSWNAGAGTGYGAAEAEFARPMQWNTGGAWLLAFSYPIAIIIEGVYIAINFSTFAGREYQTASTQFASGALWISLLLAALDVLFMIMDRRRLRSFGYLHLPSGWWILLGPLIYLIIRGVVISREVKHGFGPLIAYLVTTALAVGAAIIIPVVLASQLQGAVGTVNSTAFASAIQKGLDQNGGQFTVTCPPTIQMTVGNSFTCTAIDSTGTSHALAIAIVPGTDGKPTAKLISVSPPIVG